MAWRVKSLVGVVGTPLERPQLPPSTPNIPNLAGFERVTAGKLSASCCHVRQVRPGKLLDLGGKIHKGLDVSRVGVAR